MDNAMQDVARQDTAGQDLTRQDVVVFSKRNAGRNA